MSHHVGLKKHLTTQLELLDESSFHQQSSISDFVRQIKTSAIECVENTSSTNMTIKEAVAMVTTAQSTLIDHEDMLTESFKFYTLPVMKGENTTSENQCYSETIRRLKDIETALTSLQDTKQKTEDDISEIKQWRDNFVTEQSQMEIKLEKFSKKQNQDFKNLRKEINEQDKRIEKLNKVTEQIKGKKSTNKKELEKLTLDLKEHKNTIHKISKNMQDHTDMIDNLTQEIKRHSDLLLETQEGGEKNSFNTKHKCGELLSKYDVICKLLQQRLMPIDKIIERYNQSSKNGEGKLKKIETLEKDVLKLSSDVRTFANQQVKPSTLGFIASQRRSDGTNHKEYKVITFSAVERNVGNHFDPNTGEFTAPVDGLYKASITIKQTGDHVVGIDVVHVSGDVQTWPGIVWTKDKSVEASKTFMVLIKAGDVLLLCTDHADFECTHFSCDLLGV